MNVRVVGLCDAKLRGCSVHAACWGFERQSSLASQSNVSLQIYAYRLTRLALWHNNSTIIYIGLLQSLTDTKL